MISKNDLNEKINELQSGLKMNNKFYSYDIELDKYNINSKNENDCIDSIISEINDLKNIMIEKIIDNKLISLRLDNLDAENQTIVDNNPIIADLLYRQSDNNAQLRGISEFLYLRLDELNRFKDNMKDE